VTAPDFGSCRDCGGATWIEGTNEYGRPNLRCAGCGRTRPRPKGRRPRATSPREPDPRFDDWRQAYGEDVNRRDYGSGDLMPKRK